MEKRGISVIENIVAMVLFTGAFIFTVYSMSNLVTPLLGREEAASMQIVAYNSVEKILADPAAGLAREDHILSFDRISTFLMREDEKYEELQTYLGVEEYSFKIIIASTFSRISTYGVQEENVNDPYYVTGEGSEDETYNDLVTYGDPDNDGTAEYKYNIEEFIIGDKKYDILIADSTDDDLVNYDRFYIDYDKDMWLTDEEFRGYGNLKEGESFSIEGFKYTIIGVTENEVELLAEAAVDMELGEELPYIEEGEERVYLLNKPVVVMSRLVLVASEEGNEVKRLVFMMW